MPGKARRVASRQSQLNQRRKKQNRGPRGIPAAVGARANVNNGANGRPEAQSPEPSRAAQPGRNSPADGKGLGAAKPREQAGPGLFPDTSQGTHGSHQLRRV